MYIFDVKYTTDTERKRLDYLLSRYSSGVSRPSGYIFLVEDDVARDLMEEVGARFPSENIRVYKTEQVTIEPSTINVSMTFTFKKRADEVKSFFSYLISKRRGILNKTIGDLVEYEIYTRRGRVELTASTKDNSTCTLTINIKGSKEAVNFIANEFREEIKIFGGTFRN